MLRRTDPALLVRCFLAGRVQRHTLTHEPHAPQEVPASGLLTRDTQRRPHVPCISRNALVGRQHPDDGVSHPIQHDVPAHGAGIGTPAGADRPLAVIHARDDGAANRAAGEIAAAYQIDEVPPPPEPVVYERIVP